MHYYGTTVGCQVFLLQTRDYVPHFGSYQVHKSPEESEGKNLSTDTFIRRGV